MAIGNDLAWAVEVGSGEAPDAFMVTSLPQVLPGKHFTSATGTAVKLSRVCGIRSKGRI